MLNASKYCLVWIVICCAVVLQAASLDKETFYTPRGDAVTVIRADLQHYALRLLVSPRGSRATLSALRAQQPEVVAAINGGFYRTDGQPSGFFKYQKWWSYSAKARGVIGFHAYDDAKAVIFDRLRYHAPKLQSLQRKHAWWQAYDSIVGGAPLLIDAGKLLALEAEDMLPSFVRNRYARSGVCLDQQGRFLMVMVAGGDRQVHKLGYHQGVSLPEFAELLQGLGCQQALNIDGGYSSSMYYQGRIINGHWAQSLAARRIANAIALVPR